MLQEIIQKIYPNLSYEDFIKELVEACCACDNEINRPSLGIMNENLSSTSSKKYFDLITSRDLEAMKAKYSSSQNQICEHSDFENCEIPKDRIYLLFKMELQ